MCCLITCLFSASFAFADNNLDIQALEKLVAEKQYSDALIKIQELRQNPNYANSPELIYNLGLSEWFLEQFGPALAHFRLASHLKPFSLKNIKTLLWAENELENIQKITVRKDPLMAKISLFAWPQFFFALALIPIGAALFIAVRNKSWSTSKKLNIFWPLACLSLVLFALFLTSQNTNQRVFATLTSSESINAYAGPSDESIDVGLLYPGDSVEVLQKQEEWWQIQATEIPAGWVRSNNLKVHSRLD